MIKAILKYIKRIQRKKAYERAGIIKKQKCIQVRNEFNEKSW